MFKKLFFLRFVILLGEVAIKFGDRVSNYLDYLGGCKLTVINKRPKLTIPGRFKRNIKIVALYYWQELRQYALRNLEYALTLDA
jgi:hypothetical protein